MGYGEIYYQSDGKQPRRFYLFQNTRLTNQTVTNKLYSLDTTSATAFQITATDTTLIPYSNNYIGLLRWYPDINSYSVVDMGKTDALGQTVVYVKTNDVDYRLALYEKDGTLVKLLDPLRMVCQTTPCVYNLITSLEELDLVNFGNIQSNLSFNPTTKIFTFIFNDPSQDTTLMNLTVWKDTALDSTIVCTTSSNSFTGVLVCDVSAYSGTLRAEVYRSASPPKLLAQIIEVIVIGLDKIGDGSMGLIFGVFLVILLSLIGVFNPVISIILGIVALIPLIFLGAISPSIFIIIGVLGGIVIHFLTRIQ